MECYVHIALVQHRVILRDGPYVNSLNTWMFPLVSLVMNVDLVNCVGKEIFLSLVVLSLGVYWKGWMGGLFISYLGGS